jgi:hypothetical protein
VSLPGQSMNPMAPGCASKAPGEHARLQGEPTRPQDEPPWPQNEPPISIIFAKLLPLWNSMRNIKNIRNIRNFEDRKFREHPTCQKNLKELTKVGQRTPQIANQKQIFGLIPLTPIRKFIRCATPQITNPQTNFMINMKTPYL